MARAYAMRKRADSVAATRTRILDAARELFRERLDPELITIEETASRAGVSAMTVARHFRSKAELFSQLIKALEAQGRDRMVGLRGAPVTDIRAAVHGIYNEYEEAGDFFLRMQAFEHHRPAMHELLNRARAMHRWWVETAFAPQLKRIPRQEREEVITALAVTCDLLTWKQLRVDQGLSRRKAESIVRRMVAALTKEA
jgi:AcrR family transcriptional regulator